MSQICILVTDYVANGSFASLRQHVHYMDNGFARLIRLVDYHNNFDPENAVWISEESYHFLNKSKIFGGEIIISNIGENFGETFLAPNLNYPMSLAPNSIMIKTNQNDKYIYYYFRSPQGLKQLKSLAGGSAVPKFNKSEFKHLEINIHDKYVQQHIVDTIGSVDDLIEKYNDLKNKMLKCGYTYYLKTKTENITKKIQMSSLPIKYGISIPELKRTTGKYKLFASNGFTDYINIYNTENAVIFGCRGTIGNVFYSKEKCFVLNTAFYIEAGNEYGNLFFSIYHQQGLKEFATGAAQPQITIGGLDKAELEFINNQNLNGLLDLITKYGEIIDRLEKLKNLLLQKYFN